MANAQHYEKESRKALKTLPAIALPKVWRLLSFGTSLCTGDDKSVSPVQMGIKESSVEIWMRSKGGLL